MNSRRISILIVFVLCIWCFTLGSFVGVAGQAGVGVLNVPPTFSSIRIMQQDNDIRVYLSVSDYNSWEDIYQVTISLEDNGLAVAEFYYQQYKDRTSWIKTNEFNETSVGNGLLVTTKCSVYHSNERITIADRCNLELLFVFRTEWFTRLNIVVSDREGATATTQIDYNADEMIRDSKLIFIPGIDEPFSISVPAYFLNIISLLIATLGTFIVMKKLTLTTVKRVADET